MSLRFKETIHLQDKANYSDFLSNVGLENTIDYTKEIITTKYQILKSALFPITK